LVQVFGFPWISPGFVQAREAAEVAEKKELSAMSSGVTGGPGIFGG
jgi:hypothetical protein